MRLLRAVPMRDELDYMGMRVFAKAALTAALPQPRKRAPLSWPVPTAQMPRDVCTCTPDDLVHYGPKHLCPPCRAWEDGYVLVDGERRYLRAMWVAVNVAAAMEESS